MECYKCKAEIPDNSVFCMKCGAKQLPQNDTLEDASSVFIPNDARNLFFPLKGITLGETTIEEVIRMGIEVDDFWDDGEKSFKLYWDEDEIFGITFRQEKGKRHINTMEMDSTTGIPLEWTQDFDITFDMPYQEWLDFFKKYGFQISEDHPTSGFLLNLDILNATSGDGQLKFNLLYSSQKSELRSIYVRYGTYDL